MTAPHPAIGYWGSGPVATGREPSDDHSDQEPTYRAAGTPATARASTWCAPETPDPQYTPTRRPSDTPSDPNRPVSSPAERKRPSAVTLSLVGADTAPGI